MEHFGKEDRLSALPDELIHRILSLGVTLNVVVQTSVLSKRWVNLWSTFPFLNFKPLCLNLDDFKYRKFITKFFINRNQQSETCSININLRNMDEFVTSMIICYAMSHGVKEFHLTCANMTTINNKFSFPVLKNLSLHCGVYNRLTFMDLSLPCLTTLHLDKVLYPGDHLSFKDFLYLKNLTLEGDCVLYQSMGVFRIDSPSLETFTFLQGGYTTPALCKFVVSAPRLEYFKFYGCYVPVFSVEGGLPCLQEAVFDINVGDKYRYNWDDENLMSEMIQKLVALFHEFRQTNGLTLFVETVRVLSTVSDFSEYRPSPFVNLCWLDLIDYMPPLLGYENPMIPTNHIINYLLSNSPEATVSTKLLPMSAPEEEGWNVSWGPKWDEDLM